MKRREFFKNGLITGLGGTTLGSSTLWFQKSFAPSSAGKAKNIIFLVSDGMSMGTLSMANLLKNRIDSKNCHWIDAYQNLGAKRALMNTASLSSAVTDSAAASSAWGGGVRVPNGKLNVGPNGEEYLPILQKFKNSGKSVGCVTTVPVTHATPAGFCINSDSRGSQSEIAEKYLSLEFDCFLGGGDKYFNPLTRKDERDVYKEFSKKGYQVVKTRNELKKAKNSKPILGVFAEDALPYSLDRSNDDLLKTNIPSLAEMTEKALQLLSKNQNGFVLQIEGGKVDWAAHANDTPALLYDQLEFDDAVKIALDYSQKDQDTLVIVTTDHGNSNPGLFYGKDADRNFDKILKMKHTHDWVLNKLEPNDPAGKAIGLIEYANGIQIPQEEAKNILSYYTDLSKEAIYNPYKLPYQYFAEIMSIHTSVSWASQDHSADLVELAMVGPGSENLPPYVLNTDLHHFMLHVTGLAQ
jgi:alkaline phosphatase